MLWRLKQPPHVWASLTFVIGLCCTCTAQERYQAVQRQMGTDFKIVLYADCEQAAEQAFEAAFEKAAELNAMMSDYDPESELSRLGSTSPHTEPQPVSDELWDVLAAANSLAHRTDGAFDVTVGPLTRLWRRARRQKQMPSDARLQAARSSVGYDHLVLDESRRAVTLRRTNMRLDLGGIAKGYAAQALLAVLADHGIQRALVNAGGDVCVAEPPPGEVGWKIGITPLGSQQPMRDFLTLSRAAVATSGDAWQYVVIDDVRYSHILDPRTGLGTTRQGGVTVVASDGATCDSLASALSVMGVDEGLKLIEQLPDASAMFVWLEEGKPRERRSNGFPATVRR